MELGDILKKYAVPEPSIVSKLPKGGIQLDFVGHADITRILIEIDPLWTWEPCGWVGGRPDIHIENGIATMWARLTLLGKTLIGLGSCRADKGDYEKELIGDFLRNASMRFGICLSLWTKSEWEDLGGTQKPAGGSALPRTTQSSTLPLGQITDAQKRFIKALGHTGSMPSSAGDASTLIENLKKQKEATAEEPF